VPASAFDAGALYILRTHPQTHQNMKQSHSHSCHIFLLDCRTSLSKTPIPKHLHLQNIPISDAHAAY
jgi:hypothetical protein